MGKSGTLDASDECRWLMLERAARCTRLHQEAPSVLLVLTWAAAELASGASAEEDKAAPRINTGPCGSRPLAPRATVYHLIIRP